MKEALFVKIKQAYGFYLCRLAVAQVEGRCHPIEGYTLLQLAEKGPGVGEIVEIGSFLGLSTCYLARGAKRMLREKVTAIDHFKGSPDHQEGQVNECGVLLEEGTTFNKFRENLELLEVADYVTPIVATSAEAAKEWTKPIRLLFIDGDHSYEMSKLDFELWSPFVVAGGIVCLHNIQARAGVTQFYSELMDTTTEYEHLLTANSLAVLQKKG
jgi:MMP 1-O-methyltransferase